MALAGSRDTRVLVWDPQTAAPLQTLEGHKWQVSDVAIRADGTIISSSLDGCDPSTNAPVMAKQLGSLINTYTPMVQVVHTGQDK